MAEAFAVVSIVSSIVQLVDFGTRLLQRLQEYQTTLGEIPKSFRAIKRELPLLLDTLKRTKSGAENGTLKEDTKLALLPIIEGCVDNVKALENIIDKNLPVTGDSWGKKSRKAVASLRQDTKVNRIIAEIQDHVRTLTYYHAATASTGQIISAPLPNPCSNVPFRRDPHFIDRGDILSFIDERCSQSAGRAGLVGLGGVGKSQLAIEYSYRVRERSPQTWIFFIHAGTQARFEEGYRNIAEATRVDGWNNPKADILRLVRNWLCNESNGRWLMVVDNADDSSMFCPPRDELQTHSTGNLNRSLKSLSEYVPQSSTGSILITSRSRDAAFRLVGSHMDIIKVEPMDQENALDLVKKKLQGGYEQDDAAALVKALDYMPLAITQAAAYINQRAPRVTMAKYVQDLSQGDRDRARLLDSDIGDMRRDGKASNSIMATWQISFEYIRRERPSATRLLSLMSLFDRQGIPESLLNGRYEGTNDDSSDFEDDLSMLLNFSLVSPSLVGNQLEMHRLVQLSTKRWLELNNELEEWKDKYIVVMDESYPVGRFENWTVCQSLFPHAQAVILYRHANSNCLDAWASILFKAAWYASEVGFYRTAWDMGFNALEVRENVLGEDHPDTLHSLNGLGLVLALQGKYKEAEVMHQRAGAGYKKVLGADHPNTLTSIANLAASYRNQGRWREAEELEVQVMENRERLLGIDHPSTLSSMANLAATYWNQGRWKEAEELEVQVMENRKRLLGIDHPDTLSSMANLASTYRNQGRWKEAEELDVQVMENRKRLLGIDHPDTLSSLASLASTYWNQGRWKEAEELEVQVMENRKRLLGIDHPDTLSSMANLASTYRNQGRWKEAEELEVQVMENRKRLLGIDHPETLSSIASLASTYWNQGRLKEAEELEVQVMENRKRLLGIDHPSTLSSMANLAATYRNQGRWKEAEELEAQVIENRKRLLGIDHPDTLSSMANLAATYWNQGRLKEAEELEVQVMENRERLLGIDHPDTLSSMANLASTYRNQGRWKEAEELDVQVMENRKRLLGIYHPSTLSSMANLAATYWNQGRWKEAEELEVQVMENRKRLLGIDHPSTLSSMANLAATYRNQGRLKEAEELDVQVMENRKRLLGIDHPDTLSSMGNLASTYRNQGRWKEAEELQAEGLELRKRVLGQDHPDTLNSMAHLALILNGVVREEEAITLMQDCYERRKRVFGMDHPFTKDSAETLNEWRMKRLHLGSSNKCASNE